VSKGNTFNLSYEETVERARYYFDKVFQLKEEEYLCECISPFCEEVVVMIDTDHRSAWENGEGVHVVSKSCEQGPRANAETINETDKYILVQNKQE
jgi:hypothetical protein